MVKNCVAKCDAHQFSAPIRLWLRNRVFYSIMELPRVNGKRRYHRISLHTTNYYEAREKLHYMGITFDQKIADKIRLKLAAKHFWSQKELNKIRDEAIEEYNTEYAAANPEASLLKQSKKVASVPQNYIDSLMSALLPKPQKTPRHTIQEIFNAMLLKGNNKKASKDRKKNMIVKMLEEVGLSLKDDYAKFHDIKIIDRISENVLKIKDLKNGGKKTRLAYIKELVSCACAMEPDIYSMKVIANLPKVKKDSSKSVKSHKQYSSDQLLNIFDPSHTFFQNNPDCFWICMISLFTGSRANAAITLQYDDIINEDGIDCIHFQENNGAKQLKNQAAERKVPIHHQLLDLGFLDYVKRKKSKLKASGTDFIFEGAVHKKSQAYNNKYISRNLTPFLKEIGVKKEVHDGYDFHSFRQTVSHMLQDTGLPNSYINDIIGWEGKGTMEESYSKHTLDQIKKKLDSFEYDFLKPHFAKWKAIMAKKT